MFDVIKVLIGTVVYESMDKINPSSGFLHVLVSYEDEDRYYTPECLSLSFHKYLFKVLEKKGYNYIYYIDGDYNSIRLRFANELSYAAYENELKQSHKGFFSKYKKKDRPENEENAGIVYAEDDIKPERNEPGEMLRMIASLMSSRKAAVVITAQTVFELIRQSDCIDPLRKAEKNKSQSILLLSVNADMEKSAEMFFPKESREKSLLLSGLFPDALRKQTRNIEKGYFFLFDMLKNELGPQLVFLDRFDREDYRNIAGRYFLRNISPIRPEFVDCDWVALILWACDLFPCFKYIWKIDLGDDPVLKAKNIEGIINYNFERLISTAYAIHSEFHSIDEFENELEKYIDQDCIDDMMPVYSKDIKAQSAAFEKLIKSICKQCIDTEQINAPLGPFMQHCRIRSQIRRYRYVQNKDYNSEQAFNQYFEIALKGINKATPRQSTVLLEDKYFWNALNDAVKSYQQHIDSYYVGDNLGDSIKRSMEALYMAVIENEIEIAHCQSIPKDIAMSLNSTDGLFDPDSELQRREELRERAADCLDELKNGTDPKYTYANDILKDLERIKQKRK